MSMRLILCLVMTAAACAWPKIAWGQAASSPASKPTGPICVAVLKAESTASGDSAAFGPIAGWLDDQLATTLPREGFVAVDRQVLDRILSEKTAKLAADADASVRPFFSAGILICPKIVFEDNKASGERLASITVDAVLAQTGQVLVEYMVRGACTKDGWAKEPDKEAMGRFWSDLGRNFRNRLGLPLVEVSPGKLSSPLTRLAWMRDDLDDGLRVAIDIDPRVSLLVPRHPLLTREERLLLIMGLSAPKEGDSTAGLRASPNARFSVELAEKPEDKVPFEKTPISIRVSLIAGTQTVVSDPIAGTVADYDKLRESVVKWCKDQIKTVSPQKADADLDEDTCRGLARDELTALKRLQDTYRLVEADPFCLPADVGSRALSHATRAAHLNPGNKEAARDVAMLLEYAYPESMNHSLAAYERIVAECIRYKTNFHIDGIKEGHFSFHLHAAALGTRFAQNPRLKQDDAYRYGKIAARAAADYGVYCCNYHSGYSPTTHLMWKAAYEIIEYQMLAPVEDLEAELAYWREYWKKNVDPITLADKPTFETVLVGYYARKGDYKSLRENYNVLARKFPDTTAHLWGQLRGMLQTAGDPEWKTWQPQFTQAGELLVRLGDAHEFLHRLRPDYLGCRFIPPGESLPSRQLLWTGPDAPGRVRYGQPCVQVLGAAGGDAWFLTTCGPPLTYHHHDPGRLSVCPLKTVLAADAQTKVATVEVPWPARPQATSAPATPADAEVPTPTSWVALPFKGNPALWVGTESSGMVCFVKQGDKWQGAWYGTKQGLPLDVVHSMALGKFNGKDVVLAYGSSGPGRSGRKFVWMIDQQGTVETLYRSGAEYNVGATWPQVSFPSGLSIPVYLYDARSYPKLDLKDASFRPGRGGDWPTLVGQRNPPADQDLPRVWDIGGVNGCEVDSKTLQPLPGELTNSVGSDVHVDRRLSVCYFPYPDQFPGGDTNPFALGRGRVCWGDGALWLLADEGLLAYVPAAPGDKAPLEHDRWIGPLAPAHKGKLLSLSFDGQGNAFLNGFLHGDNSIDRIRVDDILKPSQGRSTVQFRKEMLEFLSREPWRIQVMAAMAERRLDDAMTIVKDRLKDVGKVTAESEQENRDTWIDATLWQALALARSGKLDQAAEVYKSVADSTLALPVERCYAAVNRVVALLRAQRWQQATYEGEGLYKTFPFMRGRSSGMDPLARPIEEARQRAKATTQP